MLPRDESADSGHSFVRKGFMTSRTILHSRQVLVIFTSATLLFFLGINWSSTVRGQNMAVNGMVVSPSPMAAQAGLRILRQGGNAFDAAVATAAVTAVTDTPGNGSLGNSGGYATIYDAKKREVRALDYIGAAPAAAKPEMFTVGSRLWDRAHPARDSYLGTLVPGGLAGMAALLEDYGTMSWDEVLAPAIEYAENGFVVTPKTNSQYGRSNIAVYPYGASIFFKNGKAWPVGGVLKQPDLARTLRRIAAEGPGVFYGGSLAQEIVEYFKQNGGILEVEDFANYRALWKDPITTNYRDFQIYSPPPGSGGMTILQALNVLERYDVAALGHNTPEFIHLVAEVLKLAFVDDDAFNTGKDNVEVPLKRLLSKDYARTQAERIDLDRAQFYPAVKRLGATDLTNHTINHVIVDRDHNVVTMTETSMHARVAVPGTGVTFNQGMCYFSLDPDDVNLIEGGQRPRFVMSASIVMRHGKPYFALGSGGGWTIPQTILQVILRAIDFEMDADEAVKAPRFALRYLGNSIPYMSGTELGLEQGVLEAAEEALGALGHRLWISATRSYRYGKIGGLSAIKIYPRTGVLSGGADPRQEQVAAGW